MGNVYLPLQLAPNNLNQPILPNWSFSLFNVNLGASSNAAIEQESLQSVGSYGKQIGHLAEALEPFDCDVVVSSSWRFGYTPAQIRDRLPRTLGARMVDVTGNALFGAHARYREIQAWLRACRPAPGVAWRALDDSTWEFPARCPELIACDPNTGVTTRELDALVAWLNRLRG